MAARRAQASGHDEGASPRRSPRPRSSEPTLAQEIAASGETPRDALAAATEADRDDYAFLGREFLTWLVYHAEVDGGEFAGDQDIAPFTLQFGGKLTLRTLAGQVTDMTIKGQSPVGSADLRYALAGGLSVKEAELLLAQGERGYSFTLSAEYFDLKRIKLPALLAEDDDTRVDERLMLLGELDSALEYAFGEFLALRCRPAWIRTVVPALRSWLDAGI